MKRPRSIPEKLDRLYSENEVTYKGVIYLIIAINILGLCVNQILIPLKFHFDLPRLGNLDLITLISLLIAVISGIFAFQQIKIADRGSKEAKQVAIKDEIIREVNEGKESVDKFVDRTKCYIDELNNRIRELDKQVYALHVEIETHAKAELHPGALKKLSFIEGKIYEVSAAVAILNKDTEYSFRLTRLEQMLETRPNL